MPCPSFDLPAGKLCPTGKKFINVVGSVCKGCYARRGYGAFPAPQRVKLANFKATLKATKSKVARRIWVDSLVGLICASDTRHFRWHSSGDLISLEHLYMVAEVASRTPEVKHWLPTREIDFVRKYEAETFFPSNLTVRLSATMIGEVLGDEGLPTSSVSSGIGFKCPATYFKKEKGSACGTCRACWQASTQNIDYKRH
jgi:hypothetical protein